MSSAPFFGGSNGNGDEEEVAFASSSSSPPLRRVAAVEPRELERVLFPSSSSTSHAAATYGGDERRRWWRRVLHARLTSPSSSSDGSWFALEYAAPAKKNAHRPDYAVAHAVQGGRIALFSGIELVVAEETNKAGEEELGAATTKGSVEGLHDNEEGAAWAAGQLARCATEHLLRDTLRPPSTSTIGDEEEGGKDDRRILGNSVTFSALDRSLLTAVRDALDESGLREVWRSGCGLYVRELLPEQRRNIGEEGAAVTTMAAAARPVMIEGGGRIRSLREDDAALIDSRWEYRSDDSLDMIKSMISRCASSSAEVATEMIDDGGDGLRRARGMCLGIEVDHNNGDDGSGFEPRLAAWVLRYPNGALGMLHTEEPFRRRGCASALLAEAARRASSSSSAAAGDGFDGGDATSLPPMFSYIVDGNDGSRRLFERMGWRRVADADWVGFELVSTAKNGLSSACNASSKRKEEGVDCSGRGDCGRSRHEGMCR